MGNVPRRYACLGVSVALVVVGTISTGLLPPSLPYQIVAGGLIVLGFIVGYGCLGVFDRPPDR